MWEARQSTGVRRYHDWWPGPDDLVCRVAGEPMNDGIRRRMVDWLNLQIGKKYDWGEVFKFVTRRKVDPSGADRRWFCSELAAAAFSVASGQVLIRMPSSQISPGLLAASPLLVRSSVFDR
jgi:uncharacterized protein YycO